MFKICLLIIACVKTFFSKFILIHLFCVLLWSHIEGQLYIITADRQKINFIFVKSTWWIEWITNQSITSYSLIVDHLGLSLIKVFWMLSCDWPRDQEGTGKIMIAELITIAIFTYIFTFYTQKTTTSFR